MSERVLVLGAGFAGLELSTMLSEARGEDVEVTLIDAGDSFVFGYAKLDVLFGRTPPAAVKLPYSEVSKPGVRLLRETVTGIDPEARRVTTDAGEHEADVLVVALGADYDLGATPGLAEHGNEFYSVAGPERLAEALPSFTSGRAIVGVCDAPFKCPPAPSEAALLEAFAERGIGFAPGVRVKELDPVGPTALFDDGSELPYDLFLGVPKHRAPDVVISSGMTTGGYVPVDGATMETGHPGAYAIGDVATVGVPKAGVFAEGQARVVASGLIARIKGGEPPGDYAGRGSCFIEFGGGRVGRVDVDFRSGPKPTGTFWAPSAELSAEKQQFGSSRSERWFGL
jgi:sulfide:quinone oxidoreductase